VGDGFYISFTHVSPTTAARSAAECAIDMQREFTQILRSWKEFEHPVSITNTHRIGIASGIVYSGIVGHPKERQEKLIGSTVNLAAHLCEEGRSEGGITICPHTAGLLSRENFNIKTRSYAVGLVSADLRAEPRSMTPLFAIHYP
jgi:class 3 adenylate cyclase